MGTLWCFQCGAAYEGGVVACMECGVGLVDEPPMDAVEVGGPDEEQLAYDLHEWSFESRRMLDQLLTSRGVAHAWQGASMIVRLADEEVVDALVDEVEVAALPTLDPEAEHVAYEMSGWSAAHQTTLSERLGALGVPHEFDAAGDLVVHVEDEARVDAVLDALERTGSEPGDDGAGGDLELDGLGVNDLLSSMFGAADRLRRNARDPQGVLGFLDAVEVLERVRTPFGFEPAGWAGIVGLARDLRRLLDDADGDDGEIRERAGDLREVLVQLI